VGKNSVEGTAPNTGGWENFVLKGVGSVAVDAENPGSVELRALTAKRGELMNLRAIVLTRR
jgi:hypothetical protein